MQEENKLCDYGCGQEAKYQFKNGKWCCSEKRNYCFKQKEIIGLKQKENWKNRSKENLFKKSIKIIVEKSKPEFCEYGCGKKSEYQLKNGTWCCFKSPNSCEIIKKKNSEINKRLYKDEVRKAWNKEGTSWNKGKTKENSPDFLDALMAGSNSRNKNLENGKIDKNIWKKYWTEEKRRLKSEEKKRFYEEHPECHPNRKLAANKKKWTYPEIVAGDWFDKNNILFVKNKKIGRYYPDFTIGNIIIEIDGNRWHKDKEKDYKRDLEIARFGYIIFRIKASERIEDKLNYAFEIFGYITR